MTDTATQSRERRVLILAPTGKDASLALRVLQAAGIDAAGCTDLAELSVELDRGVGAIFVAEEAVAQDRTLRLNTWLSAQPPWSDVPVLLLARPGADSAAVASAVDKLGNVTVLERPTRVAALVSTVRSALRARERQYQIRDQLEAKALLASIVSSSDDAIISKTLEGIIISWNAGAERVFGYTAQEAIGRPILLVIPPDRHQEETTILSRLRAGKRIEHFETVRITKDGRRIDVSLSVSPLRNLAGHVVGASKIARDITETKRAAERLRAVQEQLQTVTDNMAVAVARCSRDLRYLWVSPGCATWLDVPADEIIGKRIQDIIGASALEKIRPYIARALSGERVEFEMEVPYRRLGPRWVKAVYVPTRDSRGDTDGWVAVLMDTTAHHLLEDALREADRRKDEFLAVLAHELRNPLAPIRNSLHILRLTMRGDANADSAREMMERQVDHMVRLVDDLMEVSRITRGKIDLRKEPVDMATLVRSAIETSRPLIEAARHRLTLSLPPEPLTVDGDPVRLTQVIANLLNNAAKYTDAGGQIWVTVARDGNSVALSVKDTGTGIPPGMLPHVFDLFTQADHSGRRTQGGLGIGLTLVKRLLEMHGGSVVAHSGGSGQGSEFLVRLPLAAGRPQTAPVVDGRLPIGFATRRVLVVDDNEDAAESMKLLLELLGAEARVVYNGPDALDVLSTYRPDVVLLDIGMPGMDGHEVARRIRQRPEFRSVTLIALTGWGQEEDRRRSQVAGFDYHLIKPADVRALESLLLAIDGSAARGQATH